MISGRLYKPLDTAVPQQFFATSMVLTPLIRGLLGITVDAPAHRVTIAPHLPPSWDSVSVDNVPVGRGALSFTVRRSAGGIVLAARRTGPDREPLDLIFSPALPLGARVTTADAKTEVTPGDVHAAVRTTIGTSATLRVAYSGGWSIVPPDMPAVIGERSRAPRIRSERLEAARRGAPPGTERYVVSLEGLAGRTYAFRIGAPSNLAAHDLGAETTGGASVRVLAGRRARVHGGDHLPAERRECGRIHGDDRDLPRAGKAVARCNRASGRAARMRLPPYLDGIERDVRVAVRGLLRTPTFVITAVLVLGLGIGMATAMFTVFRSVLVQKLPVVDQDRIVVMSGLQGSAERDMGRGEILRFAPETRTLSGIASVAHWGAYAFALMDADRSVVMNQAQVSGNFFSVLGVRPALGRMLRPEDDVKGAAPVMVISYGAWQREFGGDSAAIGHDLTTPVTGWHYRIVGVAPAGLDYPAGTDYWVPIVPFGTESIISVGRLAPGATLASARTEFLNAIRTLEPVSPITGVDARTFAQEMVGNVRPVLIALTAAVAMLLLIACVNVGNLLLLLRATTRARELAVRRALGARYSDVVRQLMVESTLLGAAGGAVGLLFGDLFLTALLALAPAELPRMDVIRLAGAPVWAACGVTFAAVLLFGVVPALAAAAGDPAKSLRLDARSGGESASRGRLRQGLVVSQIALAVVMLSGAGLLARTVGRLQRLDLGFSPDHVSILTLTFPFANERYNSEAKIQQLLDRIRLPTRSVPGVDAITPILIPPFLGDNVWLAQFSAEGQAVSDTATIPLTAEAAGDEEYFTTFRMPILRGRGFDGTDGAGAPLQVVVSQSVARRFWPGQDPIGKRIRARSGDGFFVGGTSWRTVVGVVADPHYRRLRTGTPMVIAPANQWYWQGTLAVRTRGDVGAVVPGLERAIQSTDPDVRIWRAQPMSEIVAAQNARAMLAALLLAAFGAAALVLAAIGLYGVMAATVRERTRELGVRMALGATPEQLRREVLGRALRVTVVGAAIGLVGAVAASRFLRALLFEVSPTDPVALAGACALLVTVALLAAYLPARRATKIDPALALRAD